jgi:competence protein ComEA
MSENALKRLKSYAEDIFSDRKKLIRILLIVFILLLALGLRVYENSKADITVESTGDAPAGGDICVDIGGAVVTPGVYNVAAGTRLYEVIDLAGGLISSADTDSINRAEYVEDGQKIIIPVRPAAFDSGNAGAASADAAEEGSAGSAAGAVPDTGADDASAYAAGAQASGSSAGSGLININYADKEELMTLPGIGEAKAQKIIDYRSSTRFRKTEDIKSVNGIGDAVYNNIKDKITV